MSKDKCIIWMECENYTSRRELRIRLSQRKSNDQHYWKSFGFYVKICRILLSFRSSKSFGVSYERFSPSPFAILILFRLVPFHLFFCSLQVQSVSGINIILILVIQCAAHPNPKIEEERHSRPYAIFSEIYNLPGHTQ